MTDNLIIGKVNIDLSSYCGSDLYSEGEIEDRLLEISEKHSPEEFRKIIESRNEWPYLYHFSKQRENIVSWLPIQKDEKILEIGAGMGAITGALCKLAKSVDSVDLSLKRSKVNANRNKDFDNLSIKVGNFTDIEPKLSDDYDWIMLIGVFEYAISYMGSKNPFEDFLKSFKKHLKPGGRIVIAIENRLGLKYFAGCKEDHTCGFFDGIENYKKGGQVRTFSKKGLEKVMNSVDITEYHFYYPYPDYKLPNVIFSDKRLPGTGELKDNLRNFDQDRLLLFDETNAFDSLTADGMFADFSNSFELIVGPDINVNYAKYSMERDDELCVFTKIIEDDGVKKVVKGAAYESAKSHIENIRKAGEELEKRFAGSGLGVNKIIDFNPEKGNIVLEYIDGKSLEEMMDECVLNDDSDAFLKLFDKYREYVNYNTEYPVADDDFIFSNVLISDDKWTLIDYEWVRFEKVDPAEVISRAIDNYLLPGNFRNKIKDWIKDEYTHDEKEFMSHVLSDNKALSQIRHDIGRGVYSLDYLTDRVAALNIRVQVYEDFGDGFSEERSYFLVDIKKHGPNILLNIPLKEGLKNLRVDPGDKPVRFYVNQIKLNDFDVTERMLGAFKNGFLDIRSCIQRNNTFIFRKEDPHIKFSLKGLDAKEGDILSIDCRAEYIY